MNKLITLLLLALIISASVAQWSEQSSGVTTTLYSVSAVDNNNVWICGDNGKVLRTTNGGANWMITASPDASLPLYNIWGIDSNRVLVTGSTSVTYVYKTINAGANWTQVFSQSGGFINAIVHLTETGNEFAMIGDPVGGRWSLWHSNNNGSTWDSAGLYIPQAGGETGYNNSAFDIGPYGNDYFWFGTNNTRIYRGLFGQNWISQPTTGQTNILAILFMDSLNGVAGGSTGMLATTNGGTNWVAAAVPGNGSVNGFAYTNNFGEMFYTRGTSIYHTTNSGLNWVAATTQTGTYTHMQRARDSGDYNIWAIRSNGGISKYTHPIGIKPISGEVPNFYSLYQNYPNPFNPVTIINYELPITNYVKLVIFDVLGREVSTLVNQKQKAGKYQVEWDASSYPSGVYFYRLASEDYVHTKKMVLIK